MSDVVLIDTSIFCEILDIPGRARDAEAVLAELESGVERGWTYLLPWATVLETGNHVGQVSHGGARRLAARRFVEAVQRSLEGEAPWAPAVPLDAHRFASLLGRFEEWALTGSGIGDLSIVDEWEKQCRLHRNRRVRIWSLDTHLSSYDRQP